jgi:hypothetical protein
MGTFKPLRAACAATLMLVASCAAAQSSSPAGGAAWVFGFAGQVDEDSNDSLLATFNWGVKPRTWLSLTAGRSTSPADRADVSADTLVAGIDHRFDKVGMRFEIERWGDPDALETEDLRAGVYFDQGRFRIGAAFETRDIEVPFTITGLLGRTFSRTAELSADGVEIDARVRPTERWQLYFRAITYDYENNLTLLPRIDRLNFLSTSTLTLANSFIDDLRMLGVEREIGRTLLNVSFTRDESAIDGAEYETYDASLLFPAGRRVDLEVNLGTGRSDVFGSGRYGGLLLLVYSR